jgi:hypothetical protein
MLIKSAPVLGFSDYCSILLRLVNLNNHYHCINESYLRYILLAWIANENKKITAKSTEKIHKERKAIKIDPLCDLQVFFVV